MTGPLWFEVDDARSRFVDVMVEGGFDFSSVVEAADLQLEIYTDAHPDADDLEIEDTWIEAAFDVMKRARAVSAVDPFPGMPTALAPRRARGHRVRARAEARRRSGRWFSIEKKAGRPPVIRIHGDIEGGRSGEQFVRALDGLDAAEIEVQVDSEGGNLFAGVDIAAAISRKRAKGCRVVGHVGEVAASAAGVVAISCRPLVMAPGARLMVHDVSAETADGNAHYHYRQAGLLDDLSDVLASGYAARSGTGTKQDWRNAMLQETWFTATEAVAVGLADRVEDRAVMAGAR